MNFLKVFGQIFWSIFYFPLWWYSKGLLYFILTLKDFLVNKEKSWALFVWIKNIFVPMYGRKDFVSFLISFFVRLVQIIFRGAIMFFWLLGAVAAFLLWLVWPLIALYGIWTQIYYK